MLKKFIVADYTGLCYSEIVGQFDGQVGDPVYGNRMSRDPNKVESLGCFFYWYMSGHEASCTEGGLSSAVD